MTLTLRPKPTMPSFALDWRGRLAVLGLITAVMASQFWLKNWTIRNAASVDSFAYAVQYYFAYAFYFFGIAVGPIWAVLDDRTGEHPWKASLRGTALTLFSALTPEAIERFPSTFGLTSQDPIYDHYRIVAGLGLTLAVLSASLFVSLPQGRITPTEKAVAGIPKWLSGSGGRFALLGALSCATMVHAQTNWTFTDSDFFKSGGLSWVLPSASLLGVLIRAAIASTWAVLDDRRTEQPWLAMVRGICLGAFLQYIATIASAITFAKRYPNPLPLDMGGVGYSNFDFGIAAFTALAFVFLPVPRIEGASR